MAPGAIANSKALCVSCQRETGRANNCQDRYLYPDEFHDLNSTLSAFHERRRAKQKELLQITQVSRHGFNLRLGQAVRNRRHDE